MPSIKLITLDYLLTESTERDETGDHKNWMQIELFIGIISPRESSLVLDHPEER